MTAWQGKPWAQVGQEQKGRKCSRKEGLFRFLTYSDVSSVL